MRVCIYALEKLLSSTKGTAAISLGLFCVIVLSLLSSFQSAYLVQSLSRMTEAVNTILPPGTVRGFQPGQGSTQAEVAARLVARIHEEMEAVGDHQRLLQLVLKNAGKALQMLAERCEYQVRSDTCLLTHVRRRLGWKLSNLQW